MFLTTGYTLSLSVSGLQIELVYSLICILICILYILFHQCHCFWAVDYPWSLFLWFYIALAGLEHVIKVVIWHVAWLQLSTPTGRCVIKSLCIVWSQDCLPWEQVWGEDGELWLHWELSRHAHRHQQRWRPSGNHWGHSGFLPNWRCASFRPGLWIW